MVHSYNITFSNPSQTYFLAKDHRSPKLPRGLGVRQGPRARLIVVDFGISYIAFPDQKYDLLMARK